MSLPFTRWPAALRGSLRVRLLAGTLVWIVDAILIYMCIRNFKRSMLIANL